MNNNNKEQHKKMLQETIAINISSGIIKLQNSWVSCMSRLFNCLPSKIRIVLLVLTGISLITWNIGRLSTNITNEQTIIPIPKRSSHFNQIMASDSLLFMERIYESRKKQ